MSCWCDGLGLVSMTCGLRSFLHAYTQCVPQRVVHRKAAKGATAPL